MYQQIVLEDVKPFGQTLFQNEPFIFQQNSKPANKTRTQAWLKDIVLHFLKSDDWCLEALIFGLQILNREYDLLKKTLKYWFFKESSNRCGEQRSDSRGACCNKQLAQRT